MFLPTRRMAMLFPLALALPACGAPAHVDSPGAETAIQGTQAPVTAKRASTWNETTTVGQIVAEAPSTARLFELLGVDYCCGGEKTLAEVADSGGHDVAQLISTLQLMGPAAAAEAPRAWADAPLEDVMTHIVDTHHAYLRRELPRLETIVATVVRVHGDEHGELAEVGELFTALQEEIGPHLKMEEDELFPAILERKPGATRLLDEMREDHDGVGAALHRIRELTSDFAVPEDACVLYKQMLTGLEALERDLHTHVHLENNVVLPRARAALKDA